jgi:hypothetical protein
MWRPLCGKRRRADYGSRQRKCVPRHIESRFSHRSLSGLDSQQRPIVFIGEDVQQSVRSLAYVANPLVQLGEQRFATQLFEFVVQDDPLESACARHFATTRAADKQVPFPGRKSVAGVERQPGRGN